MSSPAPSAGPRRVVVRVRVPLGPMTPRALGTSAAVHGAAILVMTLAGIWKEQPLVTRAVPVTLSAAPALPRPPRAAPPPPRIRPTARPPEPKAPEKPPDPAGVAPAEPVARPEPPKPKPKPAPKPAEPAASAPSPPGPTPPTAAAAPGSGVSASVATGEAFPYDYYLDSLVREVSGSWVKPRGGRPGRSCVLYFELSRTGRVSELRVEEESGNGAFDLSAMRAVELAAPLPPLPAAYRSSLLKVHFEFLP